MIPLPEIGYDHATGDFFPLHWPAPSYSVRCDGSVGPIRAQNGLRYSHRCGNGGSIPFDGHVLCWHHRRLKRAGRLVLWPPRKIDAP